jgi:hypothetical protein
LDGLWSRGENHDVVRRAIDRQHWKSPSCPADQARTRSGVTPRGVERHQARRRFGKGVASGRVDRRDDVEDVAIPEPGNLLFPAKNLILRNVGTGWLLRQSDKSARGGRRDGRPMSLRGPRFPAYARGGLYYFAQRLERSLLGENSTTGSGR